MAQLEVFLKEELVETASIDTNEDFVVGRGEGCQIVLNPEPGISRKHFHISFEKGKWQFGLMSRHGELYCAGEKVSSLDLSKAVEFSIPPYSFKFDPTIESSVVSESSNEAEDVSDRTSVMVMPSQAHLKVFDETGKSIQTFRLEGESWVAGRETTCPLFLDNPKISRRQFEIMRQEHSYFIRDLGSSNGTLVNGQPISTEEWTPLTSSDLLAVVDWVLQFELRDSGYDERVKEIDPSLQKIIQVPVVKSGVASETAFPQAPQQQVFQQPPPQAQQPPPYQSISYGPPGYQNMPLPPQTGLKKLNEKQKYIIYGLIAVVIISVAVISEMKETRAPAQQKKLSAFDRLSLEQKQMVKQIYNNASQLFYEQKYQLSQQQLQNLHRIIPNYEDSKNLEMAAEEAIKTQMEKDRLDRVERDRALTENRIQKQVAQCRAKINPQITAAEIETCVSPVVEFNPQHEGILSLVNDVKRIEAERMAKTVEKAAYDDGVRTRESLYNNAQKQLANKLYKEAIAAFQRAINYDGPDPNERKSDSRTQISSIKKKLNSMQDDYIKQSEVQYRDGKIKESIVLLEKALEINTENTELKDKLNSYMTELRKQMQSVYQEGVLEESVGEVEAAKGKWKKILDQSHPKEEYFQKARIKLKKYGAI